MIMPNNPREHCWLEPQTTSMPDFAYGTDFYASCSTHVLRRWYNFRVLKHSLFVWCAESCISTHWIPKWYWFLFKCHTFWTNAPKKFPDLSIGYFLLFRLDFWPQKQNIFISTLPHAISRFESKAIGCIFAQRGNAEFRLSSKKANKLCRYTARVGQADLIYYKLLSNAAAAFFRYT